VPIAFAYAAAHYSFSLNNEFYGGDVVKPDED